MDRTFGLMRDDPEVGPRLRDADTPQRFAFPDLDLVVNLRSDAETTLQWEWSDEIGWEPQVRLQMTSRFANRYFQGRENLADAIARRDIMAGGDVGAALRVIPIVKPVFTQYRRMIRADYPHLEV